jgi:mannose-6-phosphate isomerase-like protein (cupin superfamily)
VKHVQKEYKELLMEGRPDDGKFGRGPFDAWVTGESLNYGHTYIIHPEDATPLKPASGTPLIFEHYGTLNAGRKLNGALSLCGGVAVIPPGHAPMSFRRQNCEEALYIISGKGKVEVEDETFNFFEDNAVFLPAWAKHRISNAGDIPLEFFWAKSVPLSPYECFGYVEINGKFEFQGFFDPVFNVDNVRAPVKYWRRIVVGEKEKIIHFNADGEKARSPGQQGYNYITPANVGAITVRLVGGKGPADLLDVVKDPLKDFTMTWHNTEEIHYFIDGDGLFIVDDFHIPFKKGDTILTPARSKHQAYPSGKNYREICATGIRCRPFEGLTECAIDQREYMEKE